MLKLVVQSAVREELQNRLGGGRRVHLIRTLQLRV